MHGPRNKDNIARIILKMQYNAMYYTNFTLDGRFLESWVHLNSEHR